MDGSQGRVREFFAVGDDWERPGGDVRRGDVILVVVVAILSLLVLELLRAGAALEHVSAPAWAERLAVLVGALILLPRRRLPLTVAILAATHMFVVGLTMPAVMGQLSLQAIYFLALFSGVAWARSRSSMVLVAGAIVLFMFGWLAWQFAVGNAADRSFDIAGDSHVSGALFSPGVAAVLLTVLVNLVYFGGAIVGGQVAWSSARQRSRLQEQAATIAEQAEELRERAVVEERLRIARELHDVIAHHISVIGIHAAAGRRVMDRDPGATREALGQVEESSREAVSQMRELLGTLRAIDTAAGVGVSDRRPVPGLADLDDLVAAETRLQVEYAVAATPQAAVGSVPAPVGLALYRAVQEALTNVTRHSTATSARVVLRVERPPGADGFVEVEVTDNGRPRSGTSGSGLGQVGIRERVRSHSGQVEIGPRVGGGYRVRVRVPLPEGEGSPALPGDAPEATSGDPADPARATRDRVGS